jgi:hypothetical protein
VIFLSSITDLLPRSIFLLPYFLGLLNRLSN